MDDSARLARRDRRRGREGAASAHLVDRRPNYTRLRNTFTPQKVMSDDEIAAIHETALRVLENLGIKVLLPEARRYYAAAGALVDESTQMVRIGRDIVEDALASAAALRAG